MIEAIVRTSNLAFFARGLVAITLTPPFNYRNAIGKVYRETERTKPESLADAGNDAGFPDYAEADALPADDFDLPLAFFRLALVIQSRTGDATKIEL